MMGRIRSPEHLMTAQVDDDTGQDRPVGNPVQGGIQEGPELCTATGQCGHGPIQGVERNQNGQDHCTGQEPPGQTCGDCRHNGTDSADDGYPVGTDSNPYQSPGYRCDDALPGAT